MVEYCLVEKGSMGNQNSIVIIIAEEKKNIEHSVYWVCCELLFFVCLTLDVEQDLEFIVEDYKKKKKKIE